MKVGQTFRWDPAKRQWCSGCGCNKTLSCEDTPAGAFVISGNLHKQFQHEGKAYTLVPHMVNLVTDARLAQFLAQQQGIRIAQEADFARGGYVIA